MRHCRCSNEVNVAASRSTDAFNSHVFTSSVYKSAYPSPYHDQNNIHILHRSKSLTTTFVAFSRPLHLQSSASVHTALKLASPSALDLLCLFTACRFTSTPYSTCRTRATLPFTRADTSTDFKFAVDHYTIIDFKVSAVHVNNWRTC